jgi:O-acetyl-ADP-ribose deacetylase (regulator of RNase III)
MKIIYRTGSLLDFKGMYICHSCNIKGGFKSGVAGVIRKEMPEVHEAYLELFNKGGIKLGEVQWVQTNSGKEVGNMFCQPEYGYDGKRYVSYDAIDDAIKQINEDCADFKVAFPLIGAGLGGGDWNIIEMIIERNAKHFSPVVYTLDGVIPYGNE